MIIRFYDRWQATPVMLVGDVKAGVEDDHRDAIDVVIVGPGAAGLTSSVSIR
jgi:hypothetical protein